MIRPFHVYLYGPQRQPLPTSFEAAAARLENLPMLHFEPDGSFVWSCSGGQQQIFGMLYDAAGQIQYCDFQGRCSWQTWRELLVAVTGSDTLSLLQVLALPDQRLQDLQSFEQAVWSAANESMPRPERC